MPRPKAPWIRLDLGVHDHPKVVTMAGSLGITREQAVGHLTRFWLWLRLYRPNGSLRGLTAADIAEAAGWRGDAAGFLATLREARLITFKARVETAHGWSERNAYAVRESARKLLHTPRETDIFNRNKGTSDTAKSAAIQQRIARATGPSVHNKQDIQRTKIAPSRPETASEPTSPSPPVAVFQTTGKVQTWAVTEDDVKRWKETYPAVDVVYQLRRMREWLLANPTRRKTAKGMPRFVTTWLGKEQDRGYNRQPAEPPTPERPEPFRNRILDPGERKALEEIRRRQGYTP